MLHAPSALFMVLAFIVVLGPLVTIHELGHYLVGRWCGVGARAFSVGFGREVVGFTDRRGTRWKLSALPLGGYVMFAGDANAASAPASQDETIPAAERATWLQNRPLWQRALVAGAGPAANFLLAVAIFAGFFMAYGHLEVPAVIAGFSETSSARAAGLQVGDRITAIDGAGIDSFEDIADKVVAVPGESLRVSVRRGASSFTLPITIATRMVHDDYGNASRVGLLGIASGRGRVVAVGPLRATGLALHQCFGMMGMMVTGIRQVATGTRSVKELGGPVKIAQYAGEQMALGWREFLYFGALISINLAFINLLPIPALDGGHLLLYATEAVRRKPLNEKSQEWAFRAGMAFVLALMLFVTANDIASLRIFGG